MSWELSLVFKATVLLGVALAAVALSARARASWRHLILASSFAALSVLPVAATLVPTVGIPLPMADAAGSDPDQALLIAPLVRMAETAQVSPGPSQDPGQIPASAAPSLAAMLRGLWLLGAASLLTVFAGSLWRLSRLQRSGVSWIGGQTMADALATEAGINRRVTVIVHEHTAVPATIGVLSPTILMPPDARHWPEPDLRRVLIHELEHIRRGDWWVHLAARGVSVVYWFHPLIWIALRQLSVEAERACDDAVVKGSDRADYADQLVALATRLSTPPSRLMVSMANRSDLSRRVGAILNPSQPRGRAGTLAAATIMGIVALLVCTVASLQAVDGRHGPVGSATSGHPDASAREADTPTVRPASRLDRLGAASLPTAEQFTTTIAPRPRGETVKPFAQDISPAQPPSRVVEAPSAPYVIGPDDVLTIVAWQQKDLSAEVVVRPDGKISLPLIGDVQAAGLTPDQLRRSLNEGFKAFLSDPAVSVQVRQINSRRVFIVGQVTRPGVYQLTDSMTVLQLIATAGGLTEFTRGDAIVIARRVDGKNVNIPFDYAGFVSAPQPQQNILLLPGDTVVVR